MLSLQSLPAQTKENPDSKVNNLYSTDDGKSSQQSHCSSNSWHFGNKSGFLILGDQVKCWSGKINFDPVKFGFWLET